MSLEGLGIIGSGRGSASGAPFRGVNPANGEELDVEFRTSTSEDLDRAVALSVEAFAKYGRSSGAERGKLLRTIADKLEKGRDEIVERATLESGLPAPRIKSEVFRASGQMRLFAEVVEEGSWADARIDHADPDRKPQPKPDIRSMLRPLGPVGIFGASNFPVAFSVAGGDTASALAAGCPVVVKAHPSHPGTSEIVGKLIAEAVAACDLHEGVFSLVMDPGFEVGLMLVRHPGICAIGFTGSQRGGVALMEEASRRTRPIPVYAEMGSINPVFVLPGAMAERGSAVAAGLHGSVILGVGQFCTNPGLVLFEESEKAKAFMTEIEERFNGSDPAVMLNQGICEAYRTGMKRFREMEGVEARASVEVDQSAAGAHAGAVLFSTTADTFLENHVLMNEVFGPSTLVVRAEKSAQLLDVARSLEGQLTATVHGTDEDFETHRELIAELERHVGRVVFNGYPTGVEVCHSMVHGGPFPASSDGRTTSVGTRAIERFVRAVAWQDAPDSLLPDELKESNPSGVARLVDGERK